MDTKTKKKLLIQIAAIAEAAYRRGVQHGAIFKPSDKDAYDFRYGADFNGKLYKKSPWAPCAERKAQPAKYAESAISRLRGETGCRCFKELNALITEVGEL